MWRFSHECSSSSNSNGEYCESDKRKRAKSLHSLKFSCIPCLCASLTQRSESVSRMNCCHISVVNNAFEIGKFIDNIQPTVNYHHHHHHRSIRRRASIKGTLQLFSLLLLSIHLWIYCTLHHSDKEISGQWLMPNKKDEYIHRWICITERSA